VGTGLKLSARKSIKLKNKKLDMIEEQENNNSQE